MVVVEGEEEEGEEEEEVLEGDGGSERWLEEASSMFDRPCSVSFQEPNGALGDSVGNDWGDDVLHAVCMACLHLLTLWLFRLHDFCA